MKIIIAGATGFVGKEVVVQSIENSRISSIIVLTRRHIDKILSQHPKGAQGCVWCLGGKVEDFPDLETARKVGVNFTLTAAHAFVKGICPSLQPGQRFRFVFCSGNGAEWGQDKRLWVFSDTRKLKEAAERGLLDIAEDNRDVI
ncbi:uncharacterized protein A1O5_03353 [Cladophialophora psammophila CBS 110553]|uniref:NAD(P)-binding domain-containing protein n=1 Tax=Cladophialophora psammophila CBS 110553 TaxID=1182543 RepID=W9X9H7_9EURO|nr:uncharacterized protein A1O5_03353 [Cladophialophora psammophila CBS 110553]EXJ73591.1 hypothetical protein A1O5_03353 [Cladophialophora psammophila CBS 110553]